MFFYIGKTFTAQATGERLREVDCDKCRTTFYYRLARAATGTGHAPYYIGQTSAQQRAARAAEKSLQRRLEREAEMVCCPKCNDCDRRRESTCESVIARCQIQFRSV